MMTIFLFERAGGGGRLVGAAGAAVANTTPPLQP